MAWATYILRCTKLKNEQNQLTGAKCGHWSRRPACDLWRAGSLYTSCSAQGTSACSSSWRCVRWAPSKTKQQHSTVSAGFPTQRSNRKLGSVSHRTGLCSSTQAHPAVRKVAKLGLQLVSTGCVKCTQHIHSGTMRQDSELHLLNKTSPAKENPNLSCLNCFRNKDFC